MKHANPSDDAIRKILESARTIAIVGASNKPDRPSYGVMRTLLDAGFEVIPINPGLKDVWGQKAYPSLDAVPQKIDIVDVFRKAEDTPPVAEETVKIGARVLWLQLGISSDEAAAKATEGGLSVVMDRCIGQTVRAMDIVVAGRK
jgi:predicted CoA-binding protein